MRAVACSAEIGEGAEMVEWATLVEQRPDLAAAGTQLLYQHGVGLGFLGTVRADGGPRLHPMCPILHDGGLFALLVPSPKRAVLHRDDRYALHSFPCPENEDAFFVAGAARFVADPTLRAAVVRRFVDERAHLGLSDVDVADQELFALDVDRCLLTRTTGHGDPSPRHEVWHAVES